MAFALIIEVLFNRVRKCVSKVQKDTFSKVKLIGFDNDSFDINAACNNLCLTDTEVTPEVKSYPGFQSPEAKTLWVTGYDVACMQYYYDRNSYPVTYVKNNGEADETADVMYGAVISEVPKYSGHAFAGWYEDAALTVSFEGKTMPMHAMTLYAKWEPGKKTYQVVHQLQSADGSDTWETAETHHRSPDKVINSGNNFFIKYFEDLQS